MFFPRAVCIFPPLFVMLLCRGYCCATDLAAGVDVAASTASLLLLLAVAATIVVDASAVVHYYYQWLVLMHLLVLAPFYLSFELI